MKIKSLHIDSYRHLENLDLDFTYPEGHEKAGKPLDKICIIGQSATGKTGILELIKDSFTILDSLETVKRFYLHHPYELSFNGNIEYTSTEGALKIENEEVIFRGTSYKHLHTGGELDKLLKENLRLLYLSSELITKDAINILNQNPLDLLSSTKIEINSNFRGKLEYSNFLYEFSQNINSELWFELLYEISEYRKKFQQKASELLHTGTIGNLKKLHKEFEEWSKENTNPLVSFANYFNPILRILGLEVDLVDTRYYIPIKTIKTEEIIPISSLSTGTKSLLLTMFPLFELNTADAIILLDEPERSLFPDMQIDLINHYQRIAPHAQFIVATHSPFIAASFEPEERFILYFNDKGKVAVKKGSSPIGDDPNDILRNDFEIDYYNSFGKQAYDRYLDLKRKVSQETEPVKKKELLVELAELGDKYNF